MAYIMRFSAVLFLLFTGCEEENTLPGTDSVSNDASMVSVKVFNQQGELVGPVSVPKVLKTEAEWRAILSAEQFRILRGQGTEAPFCGTLLDNERAGVYACAGCGLPLFDSSHKFDSGTGWPSYFAPIAEENVLERTDRSHGMERLEILCARCGGHLGHVFEDGPRPTGRRYCLNSESLQFVPQMDLARLADPVLEARKTRSIVLAGGCFWCTEAVFAELNGVLDVISGYAGGDSATARYDLVASGRTDHAECVRITYNPELITEKEILYLFFTVAHDPTQLNRQGADVGRHYRSAVFYESESQKRLVEEMIAALQAGGGFAEPIVTTLEPLQGFFEAEEYHQNYARRNPAQPYVRHVIDPKIKKLRHTYPEHLKDK